MCCPNWAEREWVMNDRIDSVYEDLGIIRSEDMISNSVLYGINVKISRSNCFAGGTDIFNAVQNKFKDHLFVKLLTESVVSDYISKIEKLTAELEASKKRDISVVLAKMADKFIEE
jgi:hypothetical protein